MRLVLTGLAAEEWPDGTFGGARTLRGARPAPVKARGPDPNADAHRAELAAAISAPLYLRRKARPMTQTPADLIRTVATQLRHQGEQGQAEGYAPQIPAGAVTALGLLLDAVLSSCREADHEECQQGCSPQTCDLSAALAVARALRLRATTEAQPETELELRGTEEIRAAALREAADFAGNEDDCGCGGCDSCVSNKIAAGLRRMAAGAQQPTTPADTDPSEVQSCRSEEGITVGLVDALMSILRVLAPRNLSTKNVREALLDLRGDPDLGVVMAATGARPDEAQQPKPRRRCAHTDVVYGQCVRYLDDHDGDCEYEHQRCTCADAGDCFAPAGHYADCPAAGEQPDVAQPEPADTCRPVTVDGEIVRVHGGHEMTDEERVAFADVIRAARRRYAAEHPDNEATS